VTVMEVLVCCGILGALNERWGVLEDAHEAGAHLDWGAWRHAKGVGGYRTEAVDAIDHYHPLAYLPLSTRDSSIS